jgi:hypothetical protein
MRGSENGKIPFVSKTEEQLRAIASHPLERRLWRLRKFYGGMSGALPPTDPRILAMTEQQIDLEFMHLLLDKEERDEASGTKVYSDDSYEAEEAEEERIDSKLFIEDDFGEPIVLPKSENNDDEGEWEDIETDDF